MSGTAATHTGAQQRVVGLAPTPTPTPTPSPSSSALGSGGFPGPSPTDDEQTFDEAATSRNSLASQLTAMNTSALPADMVQDLASAWQASAEADEDFYSWASDEVGDCTPDDSGDPNLQAATGPDDNATTYKQDFAAAWDPIASQYGLTQYQWNQL